MIFNLMKPVPVQAETATMYSYNGTVLPALPEWDKEKYPYVAMCGSARCLYAFSVQPVQALSTLYDFEAPYLVAPLNDYTAWGEWELGETARKTFVPKWANYDVMLKNGSIRLSASEPVPVSMPYVLYDGEVTTTKADYSDSAGTTIQIATLFKIGDTLRITFNGVTETRTVTNAETYEWALVGNNGLNGNDTEGVDDGGEWLMTYPFYSQLAFFCYFYTRTAGTHTLKIELLKEA